MNATMRESITQEGVIKIVSIVTHRVLAAPAATVWDSLKFYEEIEGKAPFLLRLLLPQPERTANSARVQGDELTLPYSGGHYSRRIVRLEPPHRYEFDVIEQQMSSDRGVTLLSGAYTLRELSAAETDLSITTRYASRIRPRWLGEPIEAFLCRRLQRHLLDAVQAKSRG